MGRRGSSGQQLYEGPTAILATLAPLKDGVRPHRLQASIFSRDISHQICHPPSLPRSVCASRIAQIRIWTLSVNFPRVMYASALSVSIPWHGILISAQLKPWPDYYFEHCTWLYKYFDRRAFTERFTRWRTDEETDSLTLAGVAIICAIVVHCLPPHHELASTLKVFPDYKPLPPEASEKDIQSAREQAHADSSVNRAGIASMQF